MVAEAERLATGRDPAERLRSAAAGGSARDPELGRAVDCGRSERMQQRYGWARRAALGVFLLVGACRSHGVEVATGWVPVVGPSPALHLVSWNAQKFKSPDFEERLDALLRRERPDLLFLQEATREALKRDGVDALFAPSWRFPPLFPGPYGVATLTRLPTTAAKALPTKRRELGFTTPKMSLATRHHLPNGESLLAINVHCLNFERFGTAGFRAQLASVVSLLIDHAGPAVLAGDFNTWSRKRLAHLEELARRLALIEAGDVWGARTTAAKDSRFVEWALGIDAQLPLDRVFYRGFAAHAARVLPERASDHNPLAVTLFQRR